MIGPNYIRELRKTKKGNLVDRNRKKVPNLEFICTQEGITGKYNNPFDNQCAVSYAITGCAPGGAEYYYIVEQRGKEGPGVYMKINYYKHPGPMKWRRFEGWYRQGLY